MRTVIGSAVGLMLANIAIFLWAHLYYGSVLPEKLTVSLFALNLLPLLGFSLVVWLASARSLFSLLLSTAVLDAVLLANQLKLSNLGQPILLVDFLSASDLIEQGDVMSHYFDSLAHPLLLGVLLVAAVLALFLEKPSFRLRLYWRLPLAALLIGSLSSNLALEGWQPAYKPGANWKPYDPKINLDNYGLAFSLMHEMTIAFSELPQYEQSNLENVLSSPASRLFTPLADLPNVKNIIVILSESYFDPADLNGISGGQYDTPEYTELRTRSMTGRISVPAFGGATLRTEFELLTGVSLSHFPKHAYPFISLVLDNKNSIAWELANLGYSTTAIHPNVASFWNRQHAYPKLGFGEFLDIRDFKGAKRSGYYVSDNELIDKIRSQIRAGEKQFIYAISMENHGPWKQGRPRLNNQRVANFKVPTQISEKGRLALQQYLYHRERFQNALIKLIAQVQQMPERSIVLFFGDHLPGLQPTFDELQFSNGLKAYQQTTPYLIFDTHRDLSKAEPIAPLIDVELLGSILLDLSSKTLPAFHVQAERLHLLEDNAKASKSQAKTQDLADLQLWRFWRKPTVLKSRGIGTSAKDKFCEILAWGPKNTQMGVPFNQQPNGKSAFWLKTNCAPGNLRFRLDGNYFDATKRESLVTGAMDADEFLSSPGKHVLSLVNMDSKESIQVGTFTIIAD